MFSKNLEKITNTLKIEFAEANNLQVIKPVTVKDEAHPTNRLLILHKGRAMISTREKDMALYPNRMYFVPAGVSINMTYGSQPIAVLTQGKQGKAITNYIQPIQSGMPPTGSDLISIIDFDVKAYNGVDLFSFLEIPCFEIEENDEMHLAIKKILEENSHENIGQHQLIKSHLVIFIIALLRYIFDKKMFLQQIGIKINALMDSRLVSIFEYVGQFFKKMTKMNLQEYVKIMRINKAVELVTTTNKKIQDICKEVGINDFAYFCRIFKNAIGSTAKQLQQKYRKHFRPGR